MRRLLAIWRHQFWSLGIVRSPIRAFLEPSFLPEIAWLAPLEEDDVFYADPFGLRTERGTFLACEEYSYRTGRGRIRFALLREDRLIPLKASIEEPFHLSYPYLLRWEASVLCVPEASASGHTFLYEYDLAAFPRRWRRRAVLLEGVPTIDPTLFRFGDLWWLAAGRADARDYGKLFLWFAERPTGPWRAHPKNPVKVDRAAARPAGTPFQHGGRLYRPAQDCSRDYGTGVALQRVHRLDPSHFEEEPVRRVDPDRRGPFPDGLHTLSSLGETTLVDGKRFVFRGAESLRVLGRGLRRMVRAAGRPRGGGGA